MLGFLPAMANRKTSAFFARPWRAPSTGALVAALAAFGALAASGCSAPDPGDIPVRKPPKPAPARFDAGNIIVGAAGDGGGAAGGAFQGAPPFVQGTAELSSLHDKHTQQPLIGQQNPADKNCVDCHGPGGVAFTAGKSFVAAGTVYLTKTGAPAQGAEVRIRAPDGTGQSAYTDTAGNWFMRTFNGATDIPVGSVAGVRNQQTYSTMVTLIGTVAGSGCSQGGTCHGSPAQGRVYLSLQ